MRCIFCKTQQQSKSIEHIIPESLGNKEHILKNGVVCDKCNQYFALKIEKPVLEKPYFVSVRHRNFIENKKNKIPLEKGIIGIDPKVFIDVNPLTNQRSILVEDPKTITGIQNGTIKHMFLPSNLSPPQNDSDISRLIGKIALEALAHRDGENEEWIDEIVSHPELDPLRQYVRYGNKPDYWEYYQRRIYNEEDRFVDSNICDEPYEVLHEFILLYTKHSELYLVLAIMGIEYVINFTNPRIEGYIEWLVENTNRSPLLNPNVKMIKSSPTSLFNSGDKINFFKKS